MQASKRHHRPEIDTGQNPDVAYRTGEDRCFHSVSLSRVLSPEFSGETKFHPSDEVFKKLVPGTMVPARPHIDGSSPSC
ncbi:hypothetical protein PoB_006541900 [Plakobranchus ocellatus]|uniref:Uncharacterized protein n=1 Tax=Plakobranchus ocellatus TaxID=259542 RepID=A0AAV4D438_9GAST|nr:hypothetical protein PoB_006541900 [Plakobranchus ocellatus]